MNPGSRRFKSWQTPITIIFGVVGGIYGIIAFIDSRVERKMTEEATLQRIAALVRPQCIFNERGSIIFDSGALNVISEISIEKSIKNDMVDGLPEVVRIKPNRYLSSAPILTAIDPCFIEVRAT